ncbi:hydrolase [Tetragenococcus halophilus subsp. flandriensis]|uniref:amidohydrolase n=1 Tax=Tetragenococcus halophilus TaxID=51669 RepID=UPI0023E9518C|nr:amidohydrolase [Tetragenococcus halophilus]GMA08165.1 hydrolase [Tetragenococcus halophilus subsp. flandriensis]
MYNDPTFFNKLTHIRRHIHQHPELSGQEYQTTAYIRNFLEERNIKILESKLDTGLIAEIGKSDGKIIGLRADIDALPISEKTQLSYKSINEGVMHACGHDLHTTSLLGAAELLKQHEENLPGKVRLIFQPAEEIFQGAQLVLNTVDFNDWSALVGFHNAPDLPLGAIGFRESKQMASVDRFHGIIYGDGTHAAHPEQGSDPIVTGSQIVANLQAIVSRHVPANEQVVVSITHTTAGNTWNVIPNEFHFEGTVRTFDNEVREKVLHLLEKIVHNTADSFDQTADVNWITGPGPLNNDLKLFKKLSSSFTKNKRNVVPLDTNLGGEDFAFYQEHVPTFFASIGTGKNFPLHHPEFLVDDAALVYTVNYYLDVVKELLINDQ